MSERSMIDEANSYGGRMHAAQKALDEQVAETRRLESEVGFLRAEVERLKEIERKHEMAIRLVAETMRARQEEWREIHRLESEVARLRAALREATNHAL